MKKVLRLVLIVGGIFVLSLSPAQADVIYNTFGAGDSYNEFLGWAVGRIYVYNSDTGSLEFHDRDQGNIFWATGTYTLETIELAMRLAEGTNVLDVWLMDDDFGKPGDVIETFTFDGEMVSGGSILTGDSVLNPVLSANTIYWLVASASVDTLASWPLGDSSVNVTNASRIDQGSWITGNNPQGAFRITGTPVTDPVPEPSTMLLLGSGLFGLVGYGRKRLKK